MSKNNKEYTPCDIGNVSSKYDWKRINMEQVRSSYTYTASDIWYQCVSGFNLHICYQNISFPNN